MDESVVFFGTGPVAAESLALMADWANIEAVVTKPKPEHHKGDFPVLEVAKKLKLPVLSVTNRQELDDIFVGKTIKSRVGILVDFGIIVSQAVIDYFPKGIINSHFSILPEWRGADPITFSILSGQDMTGVSIMQLVAALDEGPLLGYGEQHLDGTETTPSLTDRLIQLSDALLQHNVPLYLSEDLIVGPQTITGRDVSYSRKLTKDDSLLDFTKSAVQLEREIRAFIEWPKSRTTLAGKEVVITKAHVLSGSNEQRTMNKSAVGTASKVGKELVIQTSDGLLVIDSLKPAGKAEMTGQAFLAGYGQHL